MITRSQFHESPLSGAIPEAEVEERLYDTFLKMRNLLEEYAFSWYPDALSERAEAMVRDMKK